MARIRLLHGDERLHRLMTIVLEARGHVIVGHEPTVVAEASATAPASGTTEASARTAVDVLVLDVGDGWSGLTGSVDAVLAATCPVVCVDDDPDPRRHRALLRAGAVRVVGPPVRVRDIVDAVEGITVEAPSAPLDPARPAEVRHDSAMETEASDVRGHTSRPARHVVLGAGDVEVSLHAFPRGALLRIVGQVDGPADPANVEVVLEHEGTRRVTRPDATGRFEVSEVPVGHIHLDVRGVGWRLHRSVSMELP